MPKLKVAKIESCQNWKLPKLDIAKIKSWKDGKVESDFNISCWKLVLLMNWIENRQDGKLPKLKVAIIWMLPIESDLHISVINYSFDIKLKVTKIESCQNWKFQI